MPTIDIPDEWIRQQGYILQSDANAQLAAKELTIEILRDSLVKAVDESRISRRFAEAALKTQRNQALELAALKERAGEPLPERLVNDITPAEVEPAT